MTRRGHTTSVDRGYAAARLNIAKAFLQQAQVSADLVEGAYSHGTVVSSASIAAIAASDAACGHALGKVNSSANHGDAIRLLRMVSGSADAVKALHDLLNQKTPSQYTVQPTSSRTATTALRQAANLVDFAATVLRT